MLPYSLVHMEIKMEGLIMYRKLSFSIFLFVSVFSISTTTHSALIDRGDGMIYDDVLDITWLQDATNLTNVFGGEWVSNLVHAGYDDWRLPRVLSSDGPDGQGNILNVTESEVSHLLIQTLGNTINPASPLGTPSIVLNNCGPFLNLTIDGCGGEHYEHPWWLDASAYGPYITYWTFNIWAGEHTPRHDLHSGLVWAVRDGDVTVSEPSLLMLFTIGLTGLGFAGRKLKQA
jgi:hypothetical protein